MVMLSMVATAAMTPAQQAFASMHDICRGLVTNDSAYKQCMDDVSAGKKGSLTEQQRLLGTMHMQCRGLVSDAPAYERCMAKLETETKIAVPIAVYQTPAKPIVTTGVAVAPSSISNVAKKTSGWWIVGGIVVLSAASLVGMKKYKPAYYQKVKGTYKKAIQKLPRF